ncbi:MULTISPECIES: anti-sigma factor domain-containing protein [unclassified Paenibacillus]|uniref:anti-sigma factor domain-containing protein n=1 Tax=unclassified Paenibacillus TaxID=185978 RepID=UPI000954F38E|nr:MULTISPECIES: anti-sigma factor domain-containing protein [unclassified Paenibacillus]ASS68898.1 anti-sigma factor domain-containing protein [Paenibacillus sp. RUD330]SIR15576.1 Anti-sigma factor N-terminus [Paenibacillus sp. RU4X]SIR22300.1 Anti-sigma factor N-terminus [Paenibacillus sp. RU4T]
MSSRGIVMEARGNKLVVLTQEGSFRKVRRLGDERIGQEIVLTAQRKMLRMPKAVIPAAVILILIALPAFWAARAEAHPVVAYLSLDVNPSFEIGVDRELNVRKLEAMNDDALPFVKGLHYEGLPAAQVMELLARRLAESSYLGSGGGAEVILAGVKLDAGAGNAVALLSRQAEQALLSAAGSAQAAGMHVTSLESTEAVREAAAAKGLSTGRMTVYLLAKSQGYNVSLDQFRSGAIQEVLSWDGGVDALVSDSRNIGSEKLQEQLEREKKAAATSLPTGSPVRKTSPAPQERPAGAAVRTQSAKPAASPEPAASPKPSAKASKRDAAGAGERSDAERTRDSRQKAEHRHRQSGEHKSYGGDLERKRLEAEKLLKEKAEAARAKLDEKARKAWEKRKAELEEALKRSHDEMERHAGQKRGSNEPR